MSISSISSASTAQSPVKIQAAEAGEAVRGKEVRNDHDSDDGAAAVAQAAAQKPTTNAMGQAIGQHLNVTA